MHRAFDHAHGGWGDGPKFPQPMALEFLLRYHATTGDPQALALVTQTLEAMARGGIYDQLGGGFHRYAVNEDWSVPHFEKMLYDNAQLARVYLHAWQVTGEPLFRTVVEETLDYIIREMTAPEGGFYATQDADSEGREGTFFLWTAEEMTALLGDDAPRFMKAYGVSAKGNFEGRTILSLKGSFEERQALAEARRKLFLARTQRPHPGRDAKILTSWNGLMLTAFAEAAQALGREEYRQVAARCAAFLLDALYRPGGRLWHVWKDDKARIEGYLEDYTALIAGLLALYQATFEPRWVAAAETLAEAMSAHFSATGGFYDTADDAETLLLRPRELQDNATPSGGSLAATVLLGLARLSGEDRYRTLAEESLVQIQPLAKQYPLAFGQWLIALDDALSAATEIALIGVPDHEGTQALLKALPGGYHPHRLLAVGVGPRPGLLQGRPQIDGKVTAYLCHGSTCRPPVTEPEALQALLGQID